MNQRTLLDALHSRQHQNPEEIALYFIEEGQPTRAISNRQLFDDATAVGHQLAEAGIAAGDVVLLVFDHSYELVKTFWGALCLGAIPSVFSYFSDKTTAAAYVGRIRETVSHVEIDHIVTTSHWEKPLAAVLPTRHILTLNAATDLATSHPPFAPNAAGTAPAFLQFSSGTTGFPKGIMLSHQAILNSIDAMADAMETTPDDVSVTWAPFYHEMGLLLGFLMPIVTGGKAVLISPFHWVREPAILFQAIEQYGGTSGWMPNFGFDLCVRRVRDEEMAGVDLSRLRMFGNGSEPVRAVTLDRFAKRFGKYGFRPNQVITAYGMAENVVLVTTSTPGRTPTVDWVSAQSLQDGVAQPIEQHADDATSFVSNGRPIPNAEVMITNGDLAPLPERHVGEIVIRTNSLFDGYFKRPDLTSTALEDGWLYTGDLGYMVAGELYICERKKDLIIAGGQNIYPDSIEAIAQQVLGSQGARVVAFGLYDDGLGTETPTLLCELRTPADAPKRREYLLAIRQAVVQQLDVALGDVRFVEKGWIRRTTSGKLARQANKQAYLNRYFQAEEIGADSDLETTITNLVEQALAIRPISRDRNLFEIGFDSLKFMQLFAAIEKQTQHNIPVTRFLERPTIATMVALLNQDTLTDESLDHTQLIERPPLKNRLRRFRQHAQQGLLLPQQSYGRVAQTIWHLAGQSWCQQRYFSAEIAALTQVHTRIGAGQPLSDAIQQSIASHLWKRWRLWSFQNPATFAQWTIIDGLDHITQAFRQNQGVILVHFHGILRRFMNFLPRHLAPQRANVLVGTTRPSQLRKLGYSSLEQLANERTTTTQTLLTGQLYLAQQALKQAGLVQLMGDGLNGHQKELLAFFDIDRQFQFGFTHLAHQANAAALPTFIRLRPNGQIHIEIKPSLSYLSPHEMLETYADLLTTHWKNHLGSVAFGQIKRFSNTPSGKTFGHSLKSDNKQAIKLPR